MSECLPVMQKKTAEEEQLPLLLFVLKVNLGILNINKNQLTMQELVFCKNLILSAMNQIVGHAL